VDEKSFIHPTEHYKCSTGNRLCIMRRG